MSSGDYIFAAEWRDSKAGAGYPFSRTGRVEQGREEKRFDGTFSSSWPSRHSRKFEDVYFEVMGSETPEGKFPFGKLKRQKHIEFSKDVAALSRLREETGSIEKV
jgi:hypothetical protein